MTSYNPEKKHHICTCKECGSTTQAANDQSIAQLFSGKKIVKSEYIPRDEIWVGTGKTRAELFDVAGYPVINNHN